MFRTKRNSLVKRLWKYKINNESKSSSQKDKSTTSHTAALPSQEDLELKSVTHSFLKRLKVDQLEVLVQVMESKGGEITPCVLVSKSGLWLGRHMVPPYVLCCRVFRWPDLNSDMEMKRLPSCTRVSEEKEAVVCCNPYHWSVVVKIDEPPTHPFRIAMCTLQSHRKDGCERSKDECPRIITGDVGLRPMVYGDDLSDYTDQTAEYDRLLWCSVAYWELRERVGRLFSVTEPSVRIFQHLPHGDGMCLRLLQKPTNLDAVKRTREKMGFGIILSREAAHKNNVNVIRLLQAEEEEDRLMSMQAAEISVSPASPDVSSSSSKLAPPLGKPEESLNKEHGEWLPFPSTSDPEKVTSQSGMYRTSDNLDLVQDAGGDDDGVRLRPGCDWGLCPHEDTSCGTTAAQQDQQYCNNRSVQDNCIFDESIEYMLTHLTSSHLTPSPSQSCYSPLLQRRNTSLSSSSTQSSSSSPVSHPQPSSSVYVKDISSRDMHDSSEHSNSSAHIINNSSCSYISSHFTDSKNSRTNSLYPAISSSSTAGAYTRAITATTTTTTTITSAATTSSNLPCKQGEVWAYNASDYPIFVNSPTLDDPESPRSLVVKKVPPGYSIKIFDYSRAKLLERTEARSVLLNDGPFDPCSVRISLAKGWGPSYSRQFITSCPCWLEVLLGVKRHSSVS